MGQTMNGLVRVAAAAKTFVVDTFLYRLLRVTPSSSSWA
jgi:hypothetical protein